MFASTELARRIEAAERGLVADGTRAILRREPGHAQAHRSHRP